MARASRDDPRPAYVQVADDLRVRVAGMKPGTRLVSNRGLAEHYGVAVMTVRQALDVLACEGLVESSPGRGVFRAGGAEPPRQAATYLVRLRLLPGMTPEQGLAQLRASIGFGRPEVTLVEIPDEQEP